MKNRMNCDVLVLGAGPAGVSFSILMAKKGYCVEILDPAFFPRAKLCGEFLNPQAVQWLNEQDFINALLELNPYPIHGMRITDKQGRSFTGHYSPTGQASGYAVSRKDFDSLLVTKAREAGIVIHEGWKAKKLLMEGQEVVGVSGMTTTGESFTKFSRVIVGADGRNNLIGRTFGWMRGILDLRKYAFLSYFENVPGLSHFGEVHIVSDGYVGIAPLNSNLANVALVIDEKAYPVGDFDKQDFLISYIYCSPLSKRFSGLAPINPVSTIGPLAFQMSRTSGHRTILIGDTCGFIDPFTGEGINYAFLTAELAARVLDEAFQSNQLDDKNLITYDRDRLRVLGKKFQLSRLLQKAIAYPSVSTFLIKKFAKSLYLGDTIVGVVGSALPIERMWNWRFLWKLVFS